MFLPIPLHRLLCAPGDMAMTTSPLLRILQALHGWLLRIHKPKSLGKVIAELLHRFVLLWRLFRAKLHLFTIGFDTTSPKGKLKPTKDDVKGPSDTQTPYTIVKNGGIISLDKTAFSLYPFSADGIRNTSRSSIRLGEPPSRSVSRLSRHPDSNHSHSAHGSIYDLPLYPTRPPSINSAGQVSISLPLPDNHSPVPDSTREELYPQLGPPAPEIVIELASDPIGLDPPGYRNEAVIHDQYPAGREHILNIPNQAYSHTSSPPPKIEIVVSGSPVDSSRNISQASLQVPSSGHSTSHSRMPETDFTTPDTNSDILSLQSISTRDITDENHKICPVFPDQTLRYSRRTRTGKGFKNMQIDPLTTVFNRPAAPGGWLRVAHPEGACYYHHPVKRIYTDSQLSDPAILNRIMDDIARLERLKETFDQPFPQNAVLMIDVNPVEGGAMETSYYFADHDERAIFFLHPVEAWDMNSAWEVSGVRSYRHLGYEMQGQYWYFVSMYPDSCSLTPSMICELRDFVLYLIGDVMTSPYSTSPYTLDILHKILEITSEMEKNAQPGYPGCMALFARHMYIFYHTMFLNCHGESYARIERDFSIFGNHIAKRTWFVRTLTLILFSAPDFHLRTLQKMWVDGIMHKAVWEQTMKSLNDEWQEFVFFSCVLLLSNVGFLSIPNVDIHDTLLRSAAQKLSYLSVVANLGTLILGLLLMRQNRTKMRDTADDVQEFLRRRNHPRLGLETLAILYSLPYALLMWSIVAFVAAFGCVFFEHSDTQTRGFVGALALVVAILVVWCIIISWENKNLAIEEKRPLPYEELQELKV